MSSASRPLTRRRFLGLAITASSALLGSAVLARRARYVGEPLAQVTVLKAASYASDLAGLLARGLEGYPAVLEKARGGRVLLKPNIVEYYSAHRVNTHPALVAAAVNAFRQAGAREVSVAEGPGHRRDMELLLDLSGFTDMLQQEKVPFVDLNLDSVAPVELPANHSGLGRLLLPETVLNADLVVSMAKLKTHHWAGATLSLKNMFGVVPGAIYGWPKNPLHWAGIGESIVDIATAVQPGFAIIDGIEAMEGDGPLYGDTVEAGVIVMGDNLTATDATAARLMGIVPERLGYLALMQGHGGTTNEAHIQQIGEPLENLRRDFRVLESLNWTKRPLSGFERFVTGRF